MANSGKDVAKRKVLVLLSTLLLLSIMGNAVLVKVWLSKDERIDILNRSNEELSRQIETLRNRHKIT